MARKIILPTVPASEITPESVYINRRRFIQAGVVATASLALPVHALVAGNPLEAKRNNAFQRDTDLENLTDEEHATTYNNFYELGIGKGDPFRNREKLKTEPWTIECSGEIAKPMTLDVDALLKKVSLEERVYRFRCVEAWSMVVPWIGFQLSDILDMLKPTAKAKYVRFESVFDPDNLPVQRTGVLDWPYVEGLRIDEAMNPLTFMAVGLYGKTLPNQNGAPIRLLLPWKYGFKSAKSIVKIELTAKQPVSTWTKSAPHEYGFYSNVNPDVNHPRWSQAHERPLGGFFSKKTELFNGYGEYVAHLYDGLDLKKYY